MFVNASIDFMCLRFIIFELGSVKCAIWPNLNLLSQWSSIMLSVYAAHEALDGKDVEGSNIRVSFANPSKSAQVNIVISFQVYFTPILCFHWTLTGLWSSCNPEK